MVDSLKAASIVYTLNEVRVNSEVHGFSNLTFPYRS